MVGEGHIEEEKRVGFHDHLTRYSMADTGACLVVASIVSAASALAIPVSDDVYSHLPLILRTHIHAFRIG